jgi:hypothetical protein
MTAKPAEIGHIDGWVDAQPFRAHLWHLMATSALDAEDIATVAGLPARLAHHLAHGRRGRPLRRISADAATRLFSLTPRYLAFLARLAVPSGPARLQLRRLRRAGWDDVTIAQRVGSTTTELDRLATSGASCSQLLTLRLTAAASAVESARWRSRCQDLTLAADRAAAA